MVKVPKKPKPELIAFSKALADGTRRAESKAIAENSLRWLSNILIEILANHIGPCFSDRTREQAQLVIRELQKLRDMIARK